ncbi:hypothetical protein [Desertivirga xinjiangensis]|uniref:hypothetical protein n=1 Tax=Desertivirga xinjiangensis TaxID=539206 RepID=UPI00210BD79A|nr:hypothetical protein [Pedobacter xinjiangensis]
MKTQFFVLGIIISICIAACKESGDLVVKPVRATKTIEFRGFALGDTIEQYFDGKKVREFHGRVTYSGRMIFDKEGPVIMDLKKKGDSKVLYSKVFEQDTTKTIPPFTIWYDGVKVSETYNYPEPRPGIEQIAFYFDFPANMPVDIVYGDASGDVNGMQYLARNVQPKQWVDFMEIEPLDGTELYVFLLKAGTKEFLIQNRFELSYIQAQLPTTGGWYQGGDVQSLFARYVPASDQQEEQIAVENLIDTFRR